MKRPAALAAVRPWRQWTLRARLVVATAVLAGIALVVADAAGIVLLRQNLFQRVDTTLDAQSRRPFRPEGGGGFRGFGQLTRSYLYRADGSLAFATGTGAGTGEPKLGSFRTIRSHADGVAYTVDGEGGPWRVKVTPTLVQGGGYTVNALSLQDVEDTERLLLLIDALVTALVLLVLGAASASVVRIGLRPLTRMEQTAAEIAGGDLTRRVVDADQHSESGRLGTALNMMLSRIEAAVDEQSASERRLRQFLADASHELRTPLTSIQGFAELYRRGGVPPGPPLDEAMGRIEDEVSRMRLLVNDLLLLARLDEERPLDRHPVDLLAVAADAVRDAHVRVPSRFIHLSVLDDRAETFEPVTVLGDEPRLRQVATNLVANALQHTPDDATITVRVGRAVDAATDGTATEPPVAAVGAYVPDGTPAAALEVADTGPGMATTEARHVFERLYRAESSRSRVHGGAGLGLSIVAAIVQAHGGRVELWTRPGQGARFRVLLPALPPVADLDIGEYPVAQEAG
jgi:two-component system OmpR family sensor kinase